ncbi:MAG: glycosyltransferase [Steroidobacteraceae bacterium]|jgi:spore maturation protein CgeB
MQVPKAARGLSDLRILLIGASQAPDSMEFHVVDSLRLLGATVEYASTTLRVERFGALGNSVIYKVTNALMREPELLFERGLLDQAKRFGPNLVLVIMGNQLSPKTVARLRQQTKVPIVCWCQDHLGTMGRQYLLGAEYDAVFLKDRYMHELFTSMVKGTQFIYLPEACNPRVHRSLELTPEEGTRYGCEVMIFGSLYYYRQAILQQLGQFRVKRWGNVPSWMVDRLKESHAGGDIVLDEKVKAVRAARIALNTLHYAEVNALNCRAFELAGCGAFQLISYKPVLSEHFAPGVELDAFYSVDDLIEKIRYYLQRPEKAAEIARMGQVRAHRDHTYEVRLREIVRIALKRDIGVPNHMAGSFTANQAPK